MADTVGWTAVWMDGWINGYICMNGSVRLTDESKGALMSELMSGWDERQNTGVTNNMF
jgi:hypothetical protein